MARVKLLCDAAKALFGLGLALSYAMRGGDEVVLTALLPCIFQTPQRDRRPVIGRLRDDADLAQFNLNDRALGRIDCLVPLLPQDAEAEGHAGNVTAFDQRLYIAPVRGV